MRVEYLSVSDAARELTEELGRPIRPRDVSLLFYHRELRDDLAPIIAGRRMIPRGYLPLVKMAVQRQLRGCTHRQEGVQ